MATRAELNGLTGRGVKLLFMAGQKITCGDMLKGKRLNLRVSQKEQMKIRRLAQCLRNMPAHKQDKCRDILRSEMEKRNLTITHHDII